MRSNIIIAAGLLLFISILVTSQRRPFNAQSKLVTDHGIVTEVYQNSFQDFVVRLKGQSKAYYIDFSGEKNLSLKQLQSKLLYRPVTIHYPENGSAANSKDRDQFISRLESDGEIVFVEE